MKRPTAQTIKLSLLALAGFMPTSPEWLAPSSVSSDTGDQSRFRTNPSPNLILFKRGTLDTEARSDLDTSREDLQAMSTMSTAAAKTTRVVQLAGPTKPEWIDALRATGVEIVGYVPNNAYIVRGDRREIGRLAELNAGKDWSDSRPVRWMGRVLAIQKLDPGFTDEMLASIGTRVDAEIELIDSTDSEAAIETINRVSSTVNREPRRFLNYLVLSVTVRAERLLEIAGLDSVLFAGPASEMRLQDERSAQIVAGNLNADGPTERTGLFVVAHLERSGRSRGLHDRLCRFWAGPRFYRRVSSSS